MRKFLCHCTDTLTGAQMILSECSFNEACMFLEQQRAKGRLGFYRGMEALSLHTSKIKFENATFLYDEERGYLLLK